MVDAEKVKQEAKGVMDSFMNSLGDIELEDEFELLRDECFREEMQGDENDSDFKQRFLNNAPKVQNDAIVANRGNWTK